MTFYVQCLRITSFPSEPRQPGLGMPIAGARLVEIQHTLLGLALAVSEVWLRSQSQEDDDRACFIPVYGTSVEIITELGS
jgi:hypothetical protein